MAFIAAPPTTIAKVARVPTGTWLAWAVNLSIRGGASGAGRGVPPPVPGPREYLQPGWMRRRHRAMENLLRWRPAIPETCRLSSKDPVANPPRKDFGVVLKLPPI